MKTLLLLRHAKSSWDDPTLDDHDRPLNARGKEDAPRMGAVLCEVGLVPQRILSSTAKRARKTAVRVARACNYAGYPDLLRDLYLAEPATFLRILQSVTDDPQRVLLVGHNPGLENLLTFLTGVEEPLPTAALACLELPIARWSELTPETRGQLKEIWRPRLID